MARRRIRPPAAETDTSASEALHTPLDRSRIMNAVIHLLQTEGLDALSMRKIADALGVKAAALYYHIKDKDQLLRELAERIGSEAAFPDSDLPWQEQIRQWAMNFRTTLHRYRDSVRIMNATFAASPHRMAHIEYLYKVLVEAGFPDAQVPWMAAMLKNQIYAFVDEESRLTDRAQRENADMAGLGEAQAHRFESLPPDRYPHVTRLASYATSVEWDREFRFGLDVLLAGFESKWKQE
ncbi:TetR family transcriptional regulator [Cohnella sp. CFH 77786]|uniref:TetR/AcrR family transcriptional regulator C-terminal domain-containing protein n=1 Tax=Cohnella sp. CFH 77786 TaxID=2662265 RepID=UPI001C60B1D2|nr:TetR/AcrR family transcriptional regulator C-terminal domain-containing protein [Cohnella sp. CFH 77786]MBW5446239.1 TetR family transcriptional regulator [Cohnella sp. CFH 77786]